jgi:hypothetical protein
MHMRSKMFLGGVALLLAAGVAAVLWLNHRTGRSGRQPTQPEPLASVTAAVQAVAADVRSAPGKIAPVAGSSKPPARSLELVTPPSGLQPESVRMKPESAQPPSPVPMVRPSNKPGPGGKASYAAQLQDVHRLGRDLAPAEVRNLLGRLEQKYDRGSGLSLTEFNAVRNDTLDALLRQRDLPEGLGRKLVAMYRDAAEDEVWRDYCVQHFQLYYEARWPSGEASAADPEARVIREAFRDAVREPKGSTAATALLGLERLSRRYPEFDRAAVAAESLSLALSDATPPGTRVTAIQLCGLMGLSDVLPSARRLAESGGSVPLRLAATATIGSLGGSGDVRLLEGLVSTAGNGYQRQAASAALQRLRERIGAGSPR